VALQALAAVLGGTQSLHCNGRDEALALPTEESARLALRTQQVIANESGVANTIDPVAGSYAIEALTNEIEQGVNDTLNRIEKAGGTLLAIESGLIQREIQDSAYRAQLAIDSGTSVVVGVNKWGATDADAEASNARSDSNPIFTLDPQIESRQIERVRAVRASRSPAQWGSALDAVTGAARDGSNLVPPILTAVEARATIGEISDTLRAVFGEWNTRA
jgi:methylmalonyl-CoA mutase N-terminal domain/subunit